MIADIIKDKLLRLPARPWVLIFKLLYIAVMLMLGPAGFMFAFVTFTLAGAAIKKDVYYILPFDRKQFKRRMFAEYVILYIEVSILIVASVLIYNFRFDFPFEKYDLYYYIFSFATLFFSGIASLVDGQIESDKGIYRIVSFLWVFEILIVASSVMKLSFFETIYKSSRNMMIVMAIGVVMAVLTTKRAISSEMRDYVSAAEEFNKRRNKK